MKKRIQQVLFVAGALFLLSFSAKKFVTIKFSEEQMNFHWQNLNNIKAVIDQSNLPHSQAKALIFAIDSLQADINKTYKLDSLVSPTPVNSKK
ncbi:hypothetical protein ACST14_09980 [Aquirufa sp. A-Brett2-15D]|jgi:hypothetical protein